MSDKNFKYKIVLPSGPHAYVNNGIELDRYVADAIGMEGSVKVYVVDLKTGYALPLTNTGQDNIDNMS